MSFKKNVKLSPPVVGPFLTIREVAILEGVTQRKIRDLCRANKIYPAQVIGGRWRIGAGYLFSLGPAGSMKEVRRKRGRPPGAKNKRPYPKGVKRPRVKKTQENENVV
jgi:hypothetical protein